jgi:prepilin-type N-terminal cleavage/methylation domain-containing protein
MKKTSLQKGFTLIELLVVVAIIGILAAIILASLGGARGKARLARATGELSNLRAAQELYYSINGEYDASFTNGETGIKNIITSLKAYDPSSKGFTDTNATGWAYYLTSPDGTIYCSDSNGYAGKNTSTLPSATSPVCSPNL